MRKERRQYTKRKEGEEAYEFRYCKICKKEFRFLLSYENRQRSGIYCSRKCASEGHKNPDSWTIKTCTKCKKQFRVKVYHLGKYCSLECSGNAKNRVKKICQRCGNKYEVMKSQEDKSRFCSRACLNYWLNTDEEIIEKMSHSLRRRFQNKENHPFFGKHHTRETRIKISIANQGRKISDTQKAEHSARMKNWWKDPEFIEKFLKCKNTRPTKPEMIFDEITPEIIRYVGDGSWWRTLPSGKHKNPDFKVTGQNKVIEIFGDYWHRNDDPEEIINLYNEGGLDCLVIWENEIYKQPDVVLDKSIEFIAS